MVLFYDTRYKRLMGIRVYIFIFLGLSYINTTQAQSLLCSDLFTPSVTHKSYSNWNTNLYQKTLHQVLVSKIIKIQKILIENLLSNKLQKDSSDQIKIIKTKQIEREEKEI